MESPIVDTFSSRATPEFQEIIQRLATIITSKHPLSVDIKWGQLTYALNSDFHHWICAVKITKKAIILTFHFGGLLDDPGGVFRTGSSKFGRSIEYRAVEAIDAAIIQNFVEQALDRLSYFKENWKEIQKSA
jgi:hypothetical protein